MDEINKIKFSWGINYSCNYRCPYCWFFGNWHGLAEHEKYFHPEEWFRAWENIHNRYGSVDIELTGGEPFLYPNFGKLIKKISELHVIIITTNLFINIEKFIAENKIDSQRVGISATFHPSFANFEDFIKNVKFLKRNGFGSMVNYLAYPPQLKLMDYYRNKFEQEGISFQIMTFWGKYNDKDYPAGYTDEERKIIDPNLGKRYPTDEKFQLSPKETEGRFCAAGQKYAVVIPDGNVVRCGGSEKGQLIGFFFDQNFKLLDSPMPCSSFTCKCNEYSFLLINEERQVEGLVEKMGISRGSIPPYKVFFTWDINRECNYRCSYCNQATLNDNVYPYPGTERLLEIWTDVFKRYGTCHIHISGGEPFVYPNFIDLIERLTEIHTFEFSTNLYWDIEGFVKNISPRRAQVGVSYHPEFADFEIFFKKTKLLKENGFNVWVNYVAYPPQLETLPIYKEKVETEGIKFSILPFNGEYEGRKYPDNYTTEEKKKLKFYTETDEVNERMLNWRTDKNISNTKGRICRMGQMYARIYPDGDVKACCGQNAIRLGNFYEGTFKLLDGPLSCESEKCPCWKSMLVGKEEEWARHWRFPII